MNNGSSTRAILAALAAMAMPALAADFAPPGGKATLSVQYRFESSGTFGPSRDKVVQLHEWQAKRSVDLSAELVARKPTPTPLMQALDAAQTARLGEQGAQMQKAQKDMAPMMADAQAIAARCGDDEKCLEREVMKMGAAMSGTPELERARKTGAQTAAVLQPGAARYQSWQTGTVKGTYAIEQSDHLVHADPGCMVLPGARCKVQHVGKGEGPLPQPPKAMTPLTAEVDTQAQTLTLLLPAPVMPLPYTDVVTSDEPKGTQQTPPGTYQRQQVFRVAADGKAAATSFTVPLKGGWRSQSGEQVVQLKGDGDQGGTLRVRWQFNVQ